MIDTFAMFVAIFDSDRPNVPRYDMVNSIAGEAAAEDDDDDD